jgi:hypothetical protein
MYSGRILLSMFLTLIMSVTVSDQATANQALDPRLILDLKQGHMKTCSATIVTQLRSIGSSLGQEVAIRYCECVGNLYFNDLTKAEYSEMVRTNGSLPNRVTAIRRQIQEHCATTHFDRSR